MLLIALILKIKVWLEKVKKKKKKGRGYMCTYGWFMLRSDRKQQNYVKQLSFNKKIN